MSVKNASLHSRSDDVAQEQKEDGSDDYENDEAPNIHVLTLARAAEGRPKTDELTGPPWVSRSDPSREPFVGFGHYEV